MVAIVSSALELIGSLVKVFYDYESSNDLREKIHDLECVPSSPSDFRVSYYGINAISFFSCSMHEGKMLVPHFSGELLVYQCVKLMIQRLSKLHKIDDNFVFTNISDHNLNDNTINSDETLFIPFKFKLNIFKLITETNNIEHAIKKDHHYTEHNTKLSNRYSVNKVMKTAMENIVLLISKYIITVKHDPYIRQVLKSYFDQVRTGIFRVTLMPYCLFSDVRAIHEDEEIPITINVPDCCGTLILCKDHIIVTSYAVLILGLTHATRSINGGEFLMIKNVVDI